MTQPPPDKGPAQPSLEPLRGDGSSPLHYIDTLVIVQMENRSFDHFFGSLNTHERRGDVLAWPHDWSNPDSGQNPIGIHDLGATTVTDPDPPHGHGSSLKQWNEGKNDGFIREYEDRLDGVPRDQYNALLSHVMGYYTRAQLPAYYALADEFTICDRWHCSLLGPTWPNRFFSHCASSDGLWSNGQPIKAKTPYVDLINAGHSMGVYHASGIYFSLLLESLPFDQYAQSPIGQFFVDAKKGELPNVSIVEPDFNYADDHPPADVTLGQAFVSSIYEALRSSPHWERTLMVVFYDEHGGFADHAAPPTVEGEERVAQGFAQLGFRVPAILAGPLVPRGQVFHDVIDHASMPKLISEMFDLPHVNLRSKLAGDLSNALDIARIAQDARQAPKKLPKVDISTDQIERMINRPSGQIELYRHFQKLGFNEQISLAARYKQAEAWLDNVARLGVANIKR